MYKFLVVLALFGAVYGDAGTFPAVPMLDGRIVGGTNANIANFRWQVSMQTSAGSHFCGGSIIGASWVLTAAHCVVSSSAASIRFRAQSTQSNSGGTLHQASRIIIHPSYNRNNLDNDVALVQVSNAFPASLAVPLFAQGENIAVGTSTIVTGWGALWQGGPGTTTLQQVAVPIVSDASCRASYGTSAITVNMICAGFAAGGRDACQGDSGGPLVHNSRLVGVVSWGRGCAQANFPGVYARVSSTSIRSFIRTNTGI